MAAAITRGPLLEFSNSERPLVGVLLQELAASNVKPKIVSDTGSVARFECTLQDTQPNRNKRLYTEEVLADAIMRPAVREKLRTRTMYGEANHPFIDDIKRQLIVDNTRVSHLITDLQTPQGGLVRGCVETAATRVGRDMRGLIVENGSTVAFSMRGVGGCRRMPGRDLLEVTKPMALVTYDWVTFPSHQSAYMDAGPLAEDAVSGTHVSVLSLGGAKEYAMAQSANFVSLVEQFELHPDTVSLDSEGSHLVVHSGTTVFAAFLEADVRAEFRSALLRIM